MFLKENFRICASKFREMQLMLLARTGMGMHLQLMNPSTIHFRQLRYRFISRKPSVATGPPSNNRAIYKSRGLCPYSRSSLIYQTYGPP